MATELGSAFISVGLGTNSLAGDIRRAFGSAESSGASAGGAAGRGFGKAFGVIGGALAAVGIGSFFKSAVSGAADLEQSVGAIDAVFKGSAGQMHEWAKSAATDVGLSKNEFNELGTLIGAQLKNGGTAMEEIGPKTKDLITLGADLSSMFGGDASEAVGALSSALKGERDPIERYGVSLNQAKIDAEAAALGFTKVGGSLSAEANQAATLSLIMKQTADAHGNFGRETDTLAHKQQVLNAQIADGKARIGTELLPVVTALTGALSSALGPAIDFTVRAIKEVNGGFVAMGAAFQAADGDITSSGFAGFMERVGLLAREVTGGFVAMFAAFKAGDGDVTSSGFAGVMEQIGNAARGVFDAIGPAIQAIMPSLLALVPPLFALFQALSPTSLIFQALLPVLPQIAAAIGSVIAQVLPLVISLTSQLLPIITQLISTVLPPLIDIFTNIVGAIAPLITQIAGALIPIIQALMPVIVTVFGIIASVITAVMQIVQGVIQVVTGIIAGDWGKVWEGIQNVFGGIWNAIVALVGGAIGFVWSIIQAGLGLVFGFIGDTLGKIGKFFADTWDNVVKGVSGMIDGITGFFKELPGKIMGVLSNAGSWLVDTGKNIIDGLLEGLRNAGSTIGSFFLGLLPGWIVEPFKAALGIHSPSRVFMGFGENIGQGLINGVDAMGGKISGSIEGMVTVPAVPAFSMAGSASVSGGGFGSSRVVLQVGGREFDAYVTEMSGSAISSADKGSKYARTGR